MERTARLVLLAPLLFALHWLEEAPGFVAWANSHVDRGIDDRTFTTVNFAALLITAVVALAHRAARHRASLTAAVAWFSFLMGANGLLHVIGAIVDRGYAPGVITSVLFYWPFFALFVRSALQTRTVPPIVLMAAAACGAAPMLLHGYLILFVRSRLF